METQTRQRHERVRIASPQETARSRPCTRCGDVKVWRDFPTRTLWDDATIRTVQSICRPCKSQVDMDWQRRNWEHVLAYQRRWSGAKRAEMRAERASVLSGLAGGGLPVGPLRRFLTAELAHRDIGTLAAASGVDERVIRRLLSDASKVGLVQADRLITRLGGRLDDWYPYDDGLGGLSWLAGGEETAA